MKVGRIQPLLAMAAAMAVAGYVRTVMSPLQEAIRVALALTDDQMAILQGPAIGIPIALSSVPLGALIDRFARVKLLVLFLIVSGIGVLLSAIAPTFLWLVGSRALAGVAALAILPVIFSLLADLLPIEHRGRGTMAAFVGQVIGNSLAFAVGGALLSYFGSSAWRDAMLWLALPIIPVIGWVLAVLREPPREMSDRERRSSPSAWSTLAQAAPSVALIAVGMILLETALGAALIWGAPMLSRQFELAPERIGAIMATAALISGLVGPAVGGTLADCCQRAGGPVRALGLLAILTCLIAPASCFSAASTLLTTSVLLILQMSLLTALATMAMATFTILIPNHVQGVATALLTASILLVALTVGSVAVTAAMSPWGGSHTLVGALSLVCGLAGLLAAASFGSGIRILHLRARTHERNPHFTQC